MAFALNVGTGERWLRIVAGIILLVASVVFLKSTIAGYLVDLTGCVAFLTGLVRWCPMCAIGGRQLQR